ncbi:MAG TPA: tripartite tricarboxylate transporter substrate binding protein [Xanthobacteraceae bacterium]
MVMSQPTRRLHIALITAVSSALALAPAAAFAQDAYPTRPIRLVVGFAAGGPTDIPARYVADKLSDTLGQRVVVENKPAAAGIVATRDVLAQPRDGYTLLLCTHFESINAAAYRRPGFALDDLAPISLIAKYYYAVALANAVPASDIASFTRYAKAHPGEIRYASIGTASAQELFARQLERLAGISMTKVPYRSGPMVLPDLIPGRIQFYVSPVIGVIPQARTGQLKLIGVSSAARLAAIPEVPTMREQGIDFVRFGWLGICAGKGTPPDVITRLNGAIATIVASPDYQQAITKLGSIPQSSSPDALRKVIEQTRTEVEGTIREFGLQQDQ